MTTTINAVSYKTASDAAALFLANVANADGVARIVPTGTLRRLESAVAADVPNAAKYRLDRVEFLAIFSDRRSAVDAIRRVTGGDFATLESFKICPPGSVRPTIHATIHEATHFDFGTCWVETTGPRDFAHWIRRLAARNKLPLVETEQQFARVAGLLVDSNGCIPAPHQRGNWHEGRVDFEGRIGVMSTDAPTIGTTNEGKAE